jgi:hypothetical protein
MSVKAPGTEVGAGLSLELILGGLKDTMDKVHKFLSMNPVQSPIIRPFAGAGVSDGSTYFAVPVVPAGPTFGRRWDVRRLSTWPGGATDPFAALSGVTVSVVKFSGVVPTKGTTAAPFFTDLLIAPGQCPNDAAVATHQITINPGEVLAFLFKGTANAQALFCAGQAEEYIESQGEQVIS